MLSLSNRIRIQNPPYLQNVKRDQKKLKRKFEFPNSLKKQYYF